MPEHLIIDLAAVRATNTKTFTGQPRGKDARTKLNIQALDGSDVSVEVRVPADTYSVSPSFLLGMFTASIERFGRDGFFAKYDFSSWPPALHESVAEAVDRIMNRAEVLPA
jgi:hypothetical protein